MNKLARYRLLEKAAIDYKEEAKELGTYLAVGAVSGLPMAWHLAFGGVSKPVLKASGVGAAIGGGIYLAGKGLEALKTRKLRRDKS